MNRKLYVSKVDNFAKTRYFKNPLLENMAYTSATTVNIIFIPLTLLFTYLSFQRHSIGIACLGILSGLFIWSFIEYIMHRFAFHFQIKHKTLRRLHAIFHLSHHEHVHDKRKYQTLLLISLPSTILYYYLLGWIFGIYVEPIFTGVMIGYIFYEFTHYSTHKMKMDFALARHLKQHHMSHHFLHSEKNFGVTSAFWDIIFKTRLTEHDKIQILQKKANTSS